MLRYQCADGTFVTEPDRSRQPWTVRDGQFDNSKPVVSAMRIPITRAYR